MSKLSALPAQEMVKHLFYPTLERIVVDIYSQFLEVSQILMFGENLNVSELNVLLKYKKDFASITLDMLAHMKEYTGLDLPEYLAIIEDHVTDGLNDFS